MSNIYIQEPPTNGKVLIKTSVGDIDIELWSKEAPKACRNFVQLCMEGYYQGTIFHRVIRQFIAQGGDPTGTGQGGDSVYGKPFKDEIHSRLRFVRRGLVAMANAGPHDNGSQFFFTLAPTPELQNKHTIFGKVAGDTIYNMLKLGEIDTDREDRPVHPPKILKTKILHNPFEDIIPRVLPKRDKEKESKEDKKSKAKATKNFKLLSFGEEAEEDEEEVIEATKSMRGKGKSSHDLLTDSTLSSVPAVETTENNPGQQEGEEHTLEASVEMARNKLKKEDKKQEKKRKEEEPGEEDTEGNPDEESPLKKLSKLEELKKQSEQLKKEIRASKKKETEEPSPKKQKVEDEDLTEEEKKSTPNDMLAAFKMERKKYKELKKSRMKDSQSRESKTLAMLAKFQSKLFTAKQLAEYAEGEEEPGSQEKGEKGGNEEKGEKGEKGGKEEKGEKGGNEEKGKTEEEQGEEEMDQTDMSWLSHQLQFESKDSKVIDANVHEEDRYEIFDPRNPLTKRRREASKHAMKDKKR